MGSEQQFLISRDLRGSVLANSRLPTNSMSLLLEEDWSKLTILEFNNGSPDTVSIGNILEPIAGSSPPPNARYMRF